MAVTDLRGASVSAADPPISTNPNPDLAIKAPARLATTGANITLSGLQTIDGLVTVAGDRVLVKDQTDATTNGIYNASTGSWTRTIDAANNSQWATGTQVAITSGQINGGAAWQLTSANPIIVGTSTLTFTQSSNGSILIRTDLSGTINVSSTDSYWRIGHTATTVNLPSANTRAGAPLLLKDVTALARTLPHTVVPKGADTIEGAAASWQIAANRAAIRLIPNATANATGWDIA